jgi:hypothetical protein
MRKEELTTVAVSVLPPEAVQNRINDGLYLGDTGTLDVNAVGFPVGETTLRSEKAEFPPPSEDTAAGKQFVIWLRPGTYTISATVAWTAPIAAKDSVDTTPQRLITSMTNATAVRGADEKISWKEVVFHESSMLGTAASMVPTEANDTFLTQFVTSVMVVPPGEGSFGAVRLMGVSSMKFATRPVPVLYSLTIQTLAPFVAAVGPPKVLLGKPVSGSGVSGSIPPAKYKSMAALVQVPYLVNRHRHRYGESAIVTTTSASFLAPVIIFSVFILMLFIVAIYLLSTDDSKAVVK